MRPKKIILIIIDTLRQDHLGCYGYKRNTTRNIDSLAKSAILFKNAFSVCPNTLPSIASILISKYPGNHSIGFDPEGKLNARVDKTLASILKDNNYMTAAFSGCGWLSALHLGFDIFNCKEARRDCSVINEKVFEWLDENHMHDFFMLVHYFDAHGPYISPEPYRNMFINDEFYAPPEYIQNISDKQPAFNSIPGYQILNSTAKVDENSIDHEKNIRLYEAKYDGCIRYIDENIGKIFEKLDKLNIYKDSLIIITSDHGESFGENSIFLEHGLSVTLDQIAVPLLIKPHKGWDTICDQVNIPVSSIDIMPTVLSLCDYGLNEEIQGYSLKKILEGKEDAMLKERILVSENELQYALIYPDSLMELKKKDSPSSKYYPNIIDLVDSLHEKKYYWDSGNEYVLTIIFDEYQRYRIIGDIINKYRTNDQKFKILEIGAGFKENLKKFLPFDDIYFLDKNYPPEYAEKRNYIVGDFIKSTLNETYDFVVSSDVFEHIHPSSREKFINNLIHLAEIAAIIAAPFDTPGVRHHEVLTNDLYTLRNGFENIYLHEHIQNGLPSLPFALELIKKSGFKHTVIPNGYLPRWFEMISTFFLTEGFIEFSKIMEGLYEFYNKNFYCYDNLDPAYRQVIIINKVERDTDFSSIYSKNSEQDRDFKIKYEMLQSFLMKIRDSVSNYRYHELAEKDKALTEKSKEIAKLTEDLRAKDVIINNLNASLQEKNIQINDHNTALPSIQQITIKGLRSFFGKTGLFGRDIGSNKYDIWIADNEPNKERLKKINEEGKSFKYNPTISIVIPVWNTDKDMLILAIESVIKQTYNNWELCIADGGSTKPHIKKVLKTYLEQESRIKVKFLSENNGISINSNEALSLASGDFIGFLDHDDELAPFALHEIVKLLNEHPDANLIYSDEDKLDAKRKRIAPYFKTDWSLPMLLSTNYVCHFLVYKRCLIQESSGFRRDFDGSQDYDLALRIVEKISEETIHHIPEILYHWRITPLSAASGRDAKPYAYEAGRKALKEYLRRNNIDGEVQELKDAGSYRVKKKIRNQPSLDIIIMSDDANRHDYSGEKLQKNCTEMISITKYKPSNIFIPSNINIQEAKKYSHLSSELLNKIIESDNPDHIIVMESGWLMSESFVQPDSDWIDALIEHFPYFNVGLVGTGAFSFGNVIHNVDRPCGRIFCLGRNLLQLYLQNNNIPSDFDDFQIELADYAISLGYHNLFTPHSAGNQFEAKRINKYFLNFNKKKFYTKNMQYYLPDNERK